MWRRCKHPARAQAQPDRVTPALEAMGFVRSGQGTAYQSHGLGYIGETLNPLSVLTPAALSVLFLWSAYTTCRTNVDKRLGRAPT